MLRKNNLFLCLLAVNNGELFSNYRYPVPVTTNNISNTSYMPNTEAVGSRKIQGEKTILIIPTPLKADEFNYVKLNNMGTDETILQNTTQTHQGFNSTTNITNIVRKLLDEWHMDCMLFDPRNIFTYADWCGIMDFANFCRKLCASNPVGENLFLELNKNQSTGLTKDFLIPMLAIFLASAVGELLPNLICSVTNIPTSMQQSSTTSRVLSLATMMFFIRGIQALIMDAFNCANFQRQVNNKNIIRNGLLIFLPSMLIEWIILKDFFRCLLANIIYTAAALMYWILYKNPVNKKIYDRFLEAMQKYNVRHNPNAPYTLEIYKDGKAIVEFSRFINNELYA
jgi:hypothetical protein